MFSSKKGQTMVKINRSAVAFVGDIHGLMDAFDTTIREGLRRGVTTFVQVGDFWLYSENNLRKMERVIARHCLDFNVNPAEVRFYFIDGNHEDYTLIDPYSESPQVLSHHLMYLPRGYVKTIDCDGHLVNIGCAGGAVSIDQEWRTEGKDWWPEEKPAAEDFSNLNDSVDILVSHDAPSKASTMLLENGAFASIDYGEDIDRACRDVVSLIDDVVKVTNPKLVFHGHYHRFQVTNDDDGHTIVSLGKNGETGSMVIISQETKEMTLPVLGDTIQGWFKDATIPIDSLKGRDILSREELLDAQ